MMNWLKIIATLTMLSFFSSANAQGYCNDVGVAEEDADGVITFTGNQNDADCAFAPDEYTVTIYQMGLCTSPPTRPTGITSYNLDSSCVAIIVSPDGQAVNLAAGGEMTLSDVTRPPNGSYSYGYLVMANTFGIKAKKQFTNTMHTFDSGTSGNFCWTKDATAASSDSDNAGWTDPSPLVECGGASGTAGTYTEVLDQFDTNDYEEGPIAVTGGTLSADLITAASGMVVSAPNTADRLFGVQTFTSPVVIAPSSTEFTVSFGVNQASSLWYFEDLGLGANQYQVYAIGSGPFSTSMTAN